MSIIKLVHGPAGADECWALDRYGRLRPLMLPAKYHGKRAPIEALCGAPWCAVDSSLPRTSPFREADSLVAVPSRWRLSQRTGSSLAQRMELPMQRKGLTWVGRPPVQLKTLPVAQRANAVRNKMVAAPIAGTVLVVDDSVESTATFAEASRALRVAGADRVVCVALAQI